jgi:acetyl-CoA carboxylase beta subunit
MQNQDKTGSNPKMAPKLILKCTKCGGYILAAQEQKTKNCPYCGTNVNLQKAQRVAAAKDAVEASEIIKRLKAEKGFNHKP